MIYKMNYELINNKQWFSTNTKSLTSSTPATPGTKNEVKSIVGIEDSYLDLVSNIIRYLELTDDKSQLVSVPFKPDDFVEIKDIDSVPLDIKKFCADVRVIPKSDFGRNLLEIVLFPISKNVVVEGKALYLTKANDDNFDAYKSLLSNSEIRKSVLKYIDQIPEIKKGVITTRTTLKSYRQNPTVYTLCTDIRTNTSNFHHRYVYLGLFLESILYEVVDNTRGHRSKARIVNYLIDILSKSFSTPIKSSSSSIT